MIVAESDSYRQILKAQFGIKEFRIGQQEIISAILKKHDVLAILPTGGGKSLCFQFAAAFENKLVIVISPLIALMRDQVSAAHRFGLRSGCIHSGQSYDDKRQVFSDIEKGGGYILYLSPERAQKEGFQKWIKNKDIALFAVDEAHCVSQWGHDFREEYGQLKILKELRPDVPVLALTASATPVVIADIAKNLNLKSAKKMVHGFYRPNLYYQVENCIDDDFKFNYLSQALRQNAKGRCLIYCGTRKVTESLAARLKREFKEVGFYHAGLSPDQRTQTQTDYAEGRLRILVATNAFGMGIDQPDVRLVVHYQLPANIDSLYQEMGRAGRDNSPSACLLLYAKKDKGLQSFFIQNSDAPADIKSARYRNLEALLAYADGGECRHAEILTYYQDSQRISACGHCDVCDPNASRKILAPVTEIVETRLRKTKTAKKRGTPEAVILDVAQESYFQALKKWRKAKAVELDLPAFVIFSDKTLRLMAFSAPTNLEDLSKVHGVGEAKLEKFGAELVAQMKTII